MTSTGAAAPAVRARLWSNRSFVRFWSAQTVSEFGTAVRLVALPLVAVLDLRLSAFELGLLASVSSLPALALSPFAGVVVDRWDRRRLLISLDWARAVVLGSIPLAVATGWLSFAVLLVAGALSGLFDLLYDIAGQTFVSQIVCAESLADANGKLETTGSAAYIAGPGVGGWLAGLITAPMAILVDVGSFVFSALALSGLRATNPPDNPPGTSTKDRIGAADALRSFLRDTGEGFRALWRDRLVRAFTGSYALLTLFARLQTAILFLFLVDTVGLTAGLIGLALTCSGFSSLGAAVLASWLHRVLGAGRLIVVSQLIVVVAAVLLASVSGPRWLAMVMLIVAESLFVVATTLYGVATRTVMQSTVEPAVLGRVLGSAQSLRLVMITLAGVVAGGIAELTSLRVTLLAAAAGMVLTIPVIARPVVWRGVDSARAR